MHDDDDIIVNKVCILCVFYVFRMHECVGFLPSVINVYGTLAN